MHRYLRLTTLFIATVCATIGMLSGTLHAAPTGSNITTSPVSVDLAGTPGSTVTTTLQIQNNSPKAIAMSLSLQTFKAGGTNGQAQITKPAADDPSVSWVHFSQTSFTANPGVWTPITMTISLPSNAALGYYYAVQVKPDTSLSILQKGTNAVAGSNVILVLVNARTAGAVEKVQVLDFSTSQKSYEYLPAVFNVTARNTGTIFFAPHGDVYISKDKTFASSLATIPVNNSGGNVLPSSNRSFQLPWKDGFPVFLDKTLAGQTIPDSKGKPIQQLRWDFANLDKLRFGKYYARLVLVYNDGQRDVPVYGNVSFWVVPWKMLLLGLVLIILILGGTFGSGRFIYRRVRRISRKH